jgi:hypothetical protein
VSEDVRKLLAPLASLRLTVVLLALSIMLVFAGTWAQIDMGIWSTLKTYFRSFLVLIPIQIFLPREWNVPGAIPFPGGFTLGGLLMLNLVTAHAVRFQFTRKRSGILLIHSGLILLLVGELVTARFAEESNMTIHEGETVSFAEDTRSIELAIIDPSDPNRDQVVVISESLLREETLIANPLLPFEIQIDDFMINSDLLNTADASPDQNARANRGIAVQRSVVAAERPMVSGVEQRGIDLPAAYVTLFANGKNLGTWLVSLYFALSSDLSRPMDQFQEVAAGGKRYLMTMRYKRNYKPYMISLIDFKHDRYLGTETPKNFSSQIRLIDPTQNEDREVLIYMNNPLRYRGETFYQASFKRGDTATILQVVRNPGWLLPYIACTVGALGMIIHFGMHLTRFLKRSAA